VSRSRLASAAVIGLVAIAAGVWIEGPVGWLAVAGGAAFAATAAYRVIRNRPRVTLSTDGIAWFHHSLEWNEIVSMRELRFRLGLLPPRLQGLALTTARPRKHTSPDRLLGADYTINISALEKPASAILDLVEQFSGRSVQRLP
jgi:hypothetical protein